jgi:hypothetical protein
VRETLARIGLEQSKESPTWGHGIVQPEGPVITKFVPIGTHHTWIGTLYEKGMVGVFALVVPMVWSFIDLISKARSSKVAQVGLSILLVLCLFTLGERIEGLAYLYWPGLVIIGIAFKERKENGFDFSKNIEPTANL